MSEKIYLGAIEAGGTKFNCAFGVDHTQVIEAAEIKTCDPETTLTKVDEFFDRCESKWGKMQSMGIACFGPVELNRCSQHYGYIIDTPKPNWTYTNIVGRFNARYKIPVGFDTDVNAAALGESLYGAGVELENIAYITVGTGIGVGAMINGKPLHGLIHGELGHIRLNPRPAEPEGVCPFHTNCAEGLASGHALALRWGAPAQSFAQDHNIWESEADYLARLCEAVTLAYSPQKIIIGGGVMRMPGLLKKIRKHFQWQLNDYLPTLEWAGGIENYIVLPGLAEQSGIIGAFELARQNA